MPSSTDMLHHAAALFTPPYVALLMPQNAEFFKAYHVRLKIKDQIVMFNYLLEQQVRVHTCESR